MIKDIIDKNENNKVNNKEIEILEKNFPSCFDKNGKFDIEKFTELVKNEDIDINIKKEGYSLNFLGKSYARYLASRDTETVIVPDEKDKNKKTENAYIVGDNLDALQHLKYSYSEQIKCIYIDPPYNTGSDGFVYNDKFEFTAEELAKKIYIEEDEAQRILDMQGKSTHSAWLAFMYPRLEIAKDLLSDDGVIFISIDDNEQANLKLLCDEIFGEGNFVATIIWRKKTGSSDAKGLSSVTEYILVYTKNKENIDIVFNKDKTGYDIKRYKLKDQYVNRRGKHYIDNLDRGSLGYIESLDFGITAPDGRIAFPNGRTKKYNDGWRWTWGKEKVEWGLKNGYIVFRKSKDKNCGWTICRKNYLKVNNKDETIEKALPFKNLILDILNTKATIELEKLLNKKVFQYSKPIELIKQILNFININNNDIILDFFSVSATTAHAVMQLNAEDGGNRKYIMVQLDEKCKDTSEAYKAGYRTIDEIGRERIRRAAAKIKTEYPEKSKNVDLDFKTYYLKNTDKDTLDKIIKFNPNMPIDAKNISEKFGNDTIIETWKIKDGYGFNANVEKIDLNGYTAFLIKDNIIGNNLYLLEDMEDKEIMELITKIETFELNLDKIIQYGYAFSFNANTMLKNNLKTLKNRNSINVITRY